MSSAKTASLKRTLQNGLAAYQDHTFLFLDRFLNLVNLRLLAFVVISGLLSLGIAAYLTQGPLSMEGFRPEQIAYLGMPDTRLQTTFYSVLCVLLFAGALLTGLVRPGVITRSAPRDIQLSPRIPEAARPYCVIAFWILVLLLYDLKLRDVVFALLAAYLMKEVLNGRFRTSQIILAFVIAFFGLYLLPLLVPPAIPDRELWIMDMHWSAVIGDGIAGAGDPRHLYEAFSAYGLLLTEFIALGQKFAPFRDLAGTEALLILVDILFFGLIFLLIRQRLGAENGRLIWASALLIMLLFAGTMSGALQNLMTPNALPLRFILLPLTALLAYAFGHLPIRRAAFLFGLIAPAFIFYNFETGVYCILAMGYGFLVRGAKEGILTLLSALLLAAIAFALSALLLILLFFDGPLDIVFQELLAITRVKIESGTSGFAGLSFYFFPPFALVMGHALMLFAGHLLDIRDRTPLSPLAFQGVVIVGLIIAIGPYEMNRYHITKMWLPLILYFLLMLPRLARGVREDRLIWSFTLIVLVAPFLFGNPVRYLLKPDPYIAAIDRLQGDVAPCIDGLPASRALCAYATEKAAELEALQARLPGAKWMSGVALSMTRLTGTEPALRKKAIFFFAHRDELRDEILADLKDVNAPYMLFDRATDKNIAGIPEAVETFQSNMLRDVGYEIAERGTYWNIAKKLPEE